MSLINSFTHIQENWKFVIICVQNQWGVVHPWHGTVANLWGRHKDFTEFNENFEKSYLLNGLSNIVKFFTVWFLNIFWIKWIHIFFWVQCSFKSQLNILKPLWMTTQFCTHGTKAPICIIISYSSDGVVKKLLMQMSSSDKVIYVRRYLGQYASPEISRINYAPSPATKSVLMSGETCTIMHSGMKTVADKSMMWGVLVQYYLTISAICSS